MRVLVACLQGPARAGVPAHGFWRTHFRNGLLEAGCDFLEVPGGDWAEALSLRVPSEIGAWKSRIWQQTLEFIRREQKIDLFLSYLYPYQTDIPAIGEIQKLGIPCVNFFCDNVREFRAAPAGFGIFDLIWVPEFEALSMYERAGFRHIHAPMPCWVPSALRTVPSAEDEPPSFIGSADTLRKSLLADAAKSGARMRVHGAGWVQTNAPDRERTRGLRRKFLATQIQMLKRHGIGGIVTKLENRLRPLGNLQLDGDLIGGPVSGNEYLRLIRESVVSIGINRVSGPYIPLYRPRTYSRLRDIEAPMLGACYLTEWTEGLPYLYEIGKEVEAYRDADELAEKLEQLIQDPAKRRSLRAAGQRRAVSEHSMVASMTKIASALGISNRRNLHPAAQ